MLQPYLDQMVSKLATDCMAQRAQRFFYKDWYAQNYNYCYDHIIQLSTVLSQHPSAVFYAFVCPTGSLQHFDALTRHDSA